jgi:hypothetical protein
MNTNELTIFLVSIAAFSGVVAALGYYILRSLGAAETASRQTAPLRRVTPQIISRRRATSFPGIICALPMHQVKRADAPMSDIWSR